MSGLVTPSLGGTTDSRPPNIRDQTAGNITAAIKTPDYNNLPGGGLEHDEAYTE